jgi:adenosylcobinamide kinase/adenosylcobinamide-phosphate guanylyltransferase
LDTAKNITSPTSPSSPRLILVLGGARSGKSSFAERLGATSGKRVAFIATATVRDEDMRTRIAHHRASRPATWPTIEEPLDLASALQQAAPRADILLLDCITLWLSNWLARTGEVSLDEDPTIGVRLNEEALAEIERLLTILDTLGVDKTLLVVSNEVGLGIVPMHTLSRTYRDILGRINQRLTQRAERVYLMIAGLAVDIKKLDEAATL